MFRFKSILLCNVKILCSIQHTLDWIAEIKDVGEIASRYLFIKGSDFMRLVNQLLWSKFCKFGLISKIGFK